MSAGHDLAPYLKTRTSAIVFALAVHLDNIWRDRKILV